MSAKGGWIKIPVTDDTGKKYFVQIIVSLDVLS